MGHNMNKSGYLILLILTASLGGFLVAGYGVDDRGLAWRCWHLRIIQGQLADLKDHLLKYRQAHGRYPTNDEGLGAMDNFESRFKVTIYRQQEESAESLGGINRGYRRLWEGMQYHLSEYRKVSGHAPRTAQELEETTLGMTLLGERWRENSKPVDVELVFTRATNLFEVSPAGLLSPWGLPYVYENRAGLDPARFGDSPANGDSKGRYSVRVDNDVYISSVGGQYYAQEYDSEWWEHYAPRFIGAGLLGVSLVVLVLLFRAQAGRAGVLALALSGAAGVGVSQLSHMTCYIMSALFSHRDKEMVAQQAALLDKYHASGVINDATYAKARAALEPSATTQPDNTRPAGLSNNPNE